MNKYFDIFDSLIVKYQIEEDQDVNDLRDFLFAMSSPANSKPAFTEIGLEILEYLQQGHEKNNKAKDIADGMNLPSKKISGAMRKLVTDGYVEKFGQNPVIYSLTEQGKNFSINDYKETINNE